MKWAVYVLGVFFLLSVVQAVDCDYNEEPYYGVGENPSIYCKTENSSYCVAVVTQLDGSVINTYPEFEIIPNYGVINYYLCNHSCSIEFDNEDLRHNRTVTFGVLCNSGESFWVNVTPQFKTGISSYEVIDRGIWIKDNIGFIIGIIFIIILFLIFIIWVLWMVFR